MSRRLITNNKCPLCGEEVEQVPDSILKQTPHYNNVELVVTKRGLKQYIHSSCWYDMIKEKRPYNGRMYV
jgi:uncharacterized protein with PIN domain